MLVFLHSQDGISQQNIADKFEISKVAAFRLISSLENRGLVSRQSDHRDGRLKLVYLTEKGKNLYKKLIVLAQDNFKECGDGIQPEELETLKKILKKIIKNSQKENACDIS